jgi:hypothetical protein
MKNNIEEARKHYQRVDGALADIAANRLRELDSKDAVETANWLATVKLPEPAPATGPGTPGSRPGFEAATPPTDAAGGAPSTMEEILGELGAEADASRYGGEATAPAGDSGAETAPAGEADATTSGAAADAGAPAEGGEAASEAPASAPAAETPSPAEIAPPAETPPAQPPADAGDDAEEAEEPAAQPAAADASARQ